MFAGRMFGNNGWGDGNGAQGMEIQNQLNSLRDQMNNNQNSNLIMDAIKGNNCAISQLAQTLNCDFNALQGAICDVRGGIDRLSGQVGFSAERVINAVNMGDCNVIQAMKDCCCQTQQNILKMGYENQLANCNQTNTIMTGISTLSTGVERGFSSVAYANQQQTCDLMNNQNANTQRIIDALNSHWSAEDKLKIQDLKFELSQERQNRYLANVMTNGCGCNTGCNCNY